MPLWSTEQRRALQQPGSRGCTAASIHTALNNNTPQRTADSVASTLPRVSPCVCVCLYAQETQRREGTGCVRDKERERLTVIGLHFCALHTLDMNAGVLEDKSRSEVCLHLSATLMPQILFTKGSSKK